MSQSFNGKGKLSAGSNLVEISLRFISRILKLALSKNNLYLKYYYIYCKFYSNMYLYTGSEIGGNRLLSF